MIKPLRGLLFLTGAALATVSHGQDLGPVNRELPGWLQFSGEYRARFEGFSNRNFVSGNDDHYLLNRARLNVKITATPWLRIFGQAQDARVFGNDRIPDNPPYQDSWDLRQAWVELGDAEKRGLSARVGRQEINIGEERLLGSSNWGNTARTFDAARLYYRWNAKAVVSAFASSVVAQTEGQFDRRVNGDNLHGLTGLFDASKVRIEPFVLWRVSPRARSESGLLGRLSTWTTGARVNGKLSPQTDFAAEMAAQTGSWGPDPVRSWAGHWRVVRTLAADRRVPRLRMEYDYASGDRNPNDNRHGTFELLYPTPHDKLGLADQVGWKNIHHLGVTGEWSLSKRWLLQTKYHEWWLAQARDGVYNAGGVLLARDASGQSGRHVGRELDLQVLGELGKQWKLGGGVGHLFPGEFLKRTTPGAGYTFPYVMLTWAF